MKLFSGTIDAIRKYGTSKSMSLLFNLFKDSRKSRASLSAAAPVSVAPVDDPARVWASEHSPELLHQRVQPHATYSPWLNDREFSEVASLMHTHTLVDVYRCHELWLLARQMKGVPGCFLEVGVWRGGTGVLLAAAARATGQQRTVYLADTFEGVVKAGEQDTRYKGGEHADTSMELVMELVASMGLRDVQPLKGIFPEDTADRVEGPVAFLHCDVDVYQSAKDIVEWTLPRLSPGGIIVFDDYGFDGCEGVTRYANELKQRGDFLFLHNLNGHAILIRR